MTTKSNRAVYGLLLLIFMFFIILMIFAAYTMRSLNADAEMGFQKDGAIAVIEIEGAIMDSKDTIDLLHLAEQDKGVKAIILRVNSPGGAVAPTQEIYEEIRRIDGAFDMDAYLAENNKKEEKKAEKKDKSKDKEEEKGIVTIAKPIYASFGSIAASGGYYIGAGTRKIYASPGTLTGSIGVIMQFVDMSKLYDWAMLNPETIKAGRYKDAGNPTRSLTKEERDLLGGMIEGVHGQFMNDIKITREKKLTKPIEELAQGQIFSGEQAKNFGLVDDLAGLWEAGRRIHTDLGLKGKFGLKVIRKKQKGAFWELLEGVEGMSKFIKMKAGEQTAPMYLYK
jgi:protease-4